MHRSLFVGIENVEAQLLFLQRQTADEVLSALDYSLPTTMPFTVSVVVALVAHCYCCPSAPPEGARRSAEARRREAGGRRLALDMSGTRP